MVAVFSLPAMAQFAQTQAQGRWHSRQVQAPVPVFRSTSCMQGSGSAYASHPQINAQGTAVTGTMAYTPTITDGPRKADPVDPDEGSDDFLPLGEAVAPLALLALEFLIIRVVRMRVRKKQILHNET